MTTDTIPTTGQQAQLCYDALATAVAVTEQRMALKSAEPFRVAVQNLQTRLGHSHKTESVRDRERAQPAPGGTRRGAQQMSGSAWGVLAALVIIGLVMAAQIATILIRHRIRMAEISAEHRGWIRGFDEGVDLYRKLHAASRAEQKGATPKAVQNT